MLFIAMRSSDLQSQLVAIVLVPLFLGCCLITYRILLHPLSSVPGPRLAAISNIWHAYHARNGRMSALGKSLHRIYGPVVRIGPGEVWFDSREAFKAIYRPGSAFEKSDFYLATALTKPRLSWFPPFHLNFPDTLDFLSETDKARYRLQRRLIGPIYQTSNLKKFEPAVDAALTRVVAQLKALNGAEIDLKEWMHIVAVECLGAAVLSWSPNYARDRSDWGSSDHSYLIWRRKSVFGLFPAAVIVETVSKSFGRIFATLWGVKFNGPSKFKPFFSGVHQRVTRRLRHALGEKPMRDDREDLMADLIQLHKARPEFTETYLRRLAITNFGAGHETTCSALTAVMAMIGPHGDVQRRVAEEVGQAGRPSVSCDGAVLLPYTQACIKEAQRLHPAISMSLSRKVPATGMRAHGFYFPPGTTVGCNPVSLHRNPEIFGDYADSFNPDRWLAGGDPDARRAMERYNLTWGGGDRTCPGRHLAELIIYKAVPVLISEFDLEVTIPPEEEIRSYFMAMLTGVKARFVPKAATDTGCL